MLRFVFLVAMAMSASRGPYLVEEGRPLKQLEDGAPIANCNCINAKYAEYENYRAVQTVNGRTVDAFIGSVNPASKGVKETIAAGLDIYILERSTFLFPQLGRLCGHALPTRKCGPHHIINILCAGERGECPKYGINTLEDCARAVMDPTNGCHPNGIFDAQTKSRIPLLPAGGAGPVVPAASAAAAGPPALMSGDGWVTVTPKHKLDGRVCGNEEDGDGVKGACSPAHTVYQICRNCGVDDGTGMDMCSLEGVRHGCTGMGIRTVTDCAKAVQSLADQKQCSAQMIFQATRMDENTVYMDKTTGTSEEVRVCRCARPGNDPPATKKWSFDSIYKVSAQTAEEVASVQAFSVPEWVPSPVVLVGAGVFGLSLALYCSRKNTQADYLLIEEEDAI